MDEQVYICIQLFVGFSLCSISYFIRNAIDNKLNDGNNALNQTLRIMLVITITVIFWQIVPNIHDVTHVMITIAHWVVYTVVSFKMIVFYSKQQRKEQTLIQYLCEIAWFFAPISSTKTSIQNKDESPKSFTVYNIMYHFVINALPSFVYLYTCIICMLCFEIYLTKCLSTTEKAELVTNDYLYLSFYCWLFTLHGIIILMPLPYAFFNTLIRLVTLNRYKVCTISNYPLLSLSIQELWNKRYNKLMRICLRENVFIPLVRYGAFKSFAAFFTFFFSGAFHGWISWRWFNNGNYVLTTFLFFILHGFVTVVESFIFAKDKTKKDKITFIGIIIRYTWTITFFIFSLPLLIRQLVAVNALFFKINKIRVVPYQDAIADYVETYNCLYPQYSDSF